MVFINCPKCNKKIRANIAFCKYCGERNRSTDNLIEKNTKCQIIDKTRMLFKRKTEKTTTNKKIISILKISAPIIVVITIAVIIMTIFLNNPINKFFELVNKLRHCLTANCKGGTDLYGNMRSAIF